MGGEKFQVRHLHAKESWCQAFGGLSVVQALRNPGDKGHSRELGLIRAEMFHAIKEHLAADADTHLENRTAKRFLAVSAAAAATASISPVPLCPLAASADNSTEPFPAPAPLQHIPDSCREPGGGRERLFSNAACQRPTSPCPPRGTNTSVDLGRVLLHAHL